MTTIAYRDGVLAADSRETSGCEDTGMLTAPCQKLFRVGKFVVALQGDSTPGMAWFRWFREKYSCAISFNEDLYALADTDEKLVERFLSEKSDFTAVVLTASGKLYIYDEWGIPQRITAPYYAVGSGAKVAYGAMHAGASAFGAVLAACDHDPYTSGPVTTSKEI